MPPKDLLRVHEVRDPKKNETSPKFRQVPGKARGLDPRVPTKNGNVATRICGEVPLGLQASGGYISPPRKPVRIVIQLGQGHSFSGGKGPGFYTALVGRSYPTDGEIGESRYQETLWFHSHGFTVVRASRISISTIRRPKRTPLAFFLAVP